MSESIKRKKYILAAAFLIALVSSVCAANSGSAEAESRDVPEASVPAAVTAAPSPPAETYEPIEGIVNILLIGTDECCTNYDDPGRGDVTMLCSLDADSKTVKLISFERSTAMRWPGHGDVMLTSTYTYGGADLTVNDIREQFMVPINAYVHIDFDGFSQIIDAMGGIDIYLSAQEAAALTEDLWYEQWFSEGDNHLDGAAALRYCRLRRTDDNWRRVERQRNAVQAIINKAKTLRLAGIRKLAKVVIPLIDTDLTKKQIMSLVFSAPKFSGMQAQQMTVPDRNRIWAYEGADGYVTGCDYEYESSRINMFLYGEVQS